jgi:transposase-like protein
VPHHLYCVHCHRHRGRPRGSAARHRGLEPQVDNQTRCWAGQALGSQSCHNRRHVLVKSVLCAVREMAGVAIRVAGASVCTISHAAFASMKTQYFHT